MEVSTMGSVAVGKRVFATLGEDDGATSDFYRRHHSSIPEQATASRTTGPRQRRKISEDDMGRNKPSTLFGRILTNDSLDSI
jgi:hypothetical protein